MCSPEDNVAIAVALADKLVTLVGMFGIGQPPTGDKDPLGLRRQTLGIVRILVEKRLALNLATDLLEPALTAIGHPSAGKLYDDLLAFIRDRLRGLLKDQGFQPDEIESVVDHTLNLNEVVPLLNAVKAFKAIPEGKTLAAAAQEDSQYPEDRDGEWRGRTQFDRHEARCREAALHCHAVDPRYLGTSTLPASD